MKFKRLTRKKPSTILCETNLIQISGQLHKPGTNGYCALGVLCHEYFGFEEDSFVGYDYGDDNIIDALRRVGINDEIRHTIIDMNDGEDKTFKEICVYLKSKKL